MEMVKLRLLCYIYYELGKQSDPISYFQIIFTSWFTSLLDGQTMVGHFHQIIWHKIKIKIKIKDIFKIKIKVKVIIII